MGGAAEQLAVAEGMMQMPAQPSTSTAAPATTEPAAAAATSGGAFNDVITHTAKDGRTYFSATLPGMANTANQGITIARHIVAPLAISQPGVSAPAGEVPKAAEAELPMAEASVATFEGQPVAAPMAFVSAPPLTHTHVCPRPGPMRVSPRPFARRVARTRRRPAAPSPRIRPLTSPQPQSLGLGATASQATSSAAGADATSALGYHPSLAGQINWGTPDDPNAAFAHHFGHVFPGMQHAYRLPQQSAAAQALAVLSGPGGVGVSAPKPKVMKPMRPKEPKEIKEPKPVKQRPPKAPKSAYLCFEQERRRLLLEARPEKVDDIVKQHGDISRAVGRQCAPRPARLEPRAQSSTPRQMPVPRAALRPPFAPAA